MKDKLAADALTVRHDERRGCRGRQRDGGTGKKPSATANLGSFMCKTSLRSRNIWKVISKRRANYFAEDMCQPGLTQTPFRRTKTSVARPVVVWRCPCGFSSSNRYVVYRIAVVP